MATGAVALRSATLDGQTPREMRLRRGASRATMRTVLRLLGLGGHAGPYRVPARWAGQNCGVTVDVSACPACNPGLGPRKLKPGVFVARLKSRTGSPFP